MCVADQEPRGQAGVEGKAAKGQKCFLMRARVSERTDVAITEVQLKNIAFAAPPLRSSGDKQVLQMLTIYMTIKEDVSFSLRKMHHGKLR